MHQTRDHTVRYTHCGTALAELCLRSHQAPLSFGRACGEELIQCRCQFKGRAANHGRTLLSVI